MYLSDSGNLEFFQSFSINKELGVLTWGNEIDIAPGDLVCGGYRDRAPGMDKAGEKAPDKQGFARNNALITTDKDFGELIFRRRQ